MFLRLSKLVITLTSILTLTACNPELLKYKLDPDFGPLEQLAGQSDMVAVKVTDQRANSILSPGDINVSSTEDEAEVLKKRLISQLKELDYKIINNPLLANLAVMLDINELSVIVKTSSFKSTVKANSVFTLTIRSKGKEWGKLFRAARTQEVANPVDENDVTGVINQLLSKQLSKAFTDPALMDFLSKSIQQSDL